MENKNPATPANAATPGADQNNNQPVANPTPQGDQGNNQEGKVTLSMKEFAALNRDASRFRSNIKRGNLNKNKNSSNDNFSDNPDAQQAIEEANSKVADAERRALQAEVKIQVRDLLDKDEFKNIPKSTKDLILKNPASLSNADNLDEALLDIEDFLHDQVLNNLDQNPANPNMNPAQKTDQPAGHETPPAINSGSQANAGEAEFEDVSKLTGPAKSQAMIRNAMRKKK